MIQIDQSEVSERSEDMRPPAPPSIMTIRASRARLSGPAEFRGAVRPMVQPKVSATGTAFIGMGKA